MSRVKASVLIATYKRAHTIGYVLYALTKQSETDFEVIIVFKNSGDNTLKIIREYSKKLNIRVVEQNEGYVVDAINQGFKETNGEIIVFLDDDAIPPSDWLSQHLCLYKRNVGGVAGDVIPSKIVGKSVRKFKNMKSEIYPDFHSHYNEYAIKIWDKPLKGQENYLLYISKAGNLCVNTNLAQKYEGKIIPSLLGMGANMSISSRALGDFKFPRKWVLGLSYEQYLAWHIWKKGYRLFYNPSAKVYHLHHGQSLSRNVVNRKRDLLRVIEHNLLFYRIYYQESGVNFFYRTISNLITGILRVLKILINKDVAGINAIKGLVKAEIIGIKWLIQGKNGDLKNYIFDLEKNLN